MKKTDTKGMIVLSLIGDILRGNTNSHIGQKKRQRSVKTND